MHRTTGNIEIEHYQELQMKYRLYSEKYTEQYFLKDASVHKKVACVVIIIQLAHRI